MVANQPDHFTHLADCFEPFWAAQHAKQGQIGLRQHAQTITHFINLALDRTLGQTEKIETGNFCQQDIVAQFAPNSFASRIAAHGPWFGAAQFDRSIVEKKRPRGSSAVSMRNCPHAKITCQGSMVPHWSRANRLAADKARVNSRSIAVPNRSRMEREDRFSPAPALSGSADSTRLATSPNPGICKPCGEKRLF